MSSTNKVFKKIFNVNKVRILNVDYYTDHKGEDHLKISVDLQPEQAKGLSSHPKASFFEKKSIDYFSFGSPLCSGR